MTRGRELVHIRYGLQLDGGRILTNIIYGEITMDIRPLPPVEYLRQCLSYDQETGIFTWKRRPREHFPTENGWKVFNKKCSGKTAGSVVNGHDFKIFYIQIKILGYNYKAHRIAHAIHFGFDYPGIIDHKDGIGTNNKIDNLRPCTDCQNMHNRKANEGKGLKGVSFRKDQGKYVARVYENRRRVFLGYFKTESEAHAAYCEAASRIYGEFARFE